MTRLSMTISELQAWQRHSSIWYHHWVKCAHWLSFLIMSYCCPCYAAGFIGNTAAFWSWWNTDYYTIDNLTVTMWSGTVCTCCSKNDRSQCSSKEKTIHRNVSIKGIDCPIVRETSSGLGYRHSIPTATHTVLISFLRKVRWISCSLEYAGCAGCIVWSPVGKYSSRRFSRTCRDVLAIEFYCARIKICVHAASDGDCLVLQPIMKERRLVRHWPLGNHDLGQCCQLYSTSNEPSFNSTDRMLCLPWLIRQVFLEGWRYLSLHPYMTTSTPKHRCYQAQQ